MLYNQLLEPISTDVTVGTPRLSTPPYTVHTKRFTILDKNPHSHTPFLTFCLKIHCLINVKEHSIIIEFSATLCWICLKNI